MTEDIYPGRRKWEAEKERRLAALYKAIVKGDSDDGLIKRVLEISIVFDSESRLPNLLLALSILPASCFWRAFMDVWTMCDDTWNCRADLLRTLRQRQNNAPARLDGEQAELFRVYRGCSESRVRGVAWTRKREVAERFAKGHRHISVPSPVVAEALVPRSRLFFFTDDRNEDEVVLDPRYLRRLRLTTSENT